MEVPGTEVSPGGDDPVVQGLDRHVDRARAIAGGVVVALVVAAAGLAIYHERHSFVDTFHKVGVWPILESFVLGCVGVGATYPAWREVLAGLDVEMPLGSGARLFFVSQLGKYLPGSVWPVLMQMEAGRSLGATRRTMLSANLITVVLNCFVGLLLACLLLPLYDAHALAHYWWVLLALPVLVGLLHPRALPFLLDRVFSLLHRAPLGERLDPRSELKASGWAVTAWLGFGGHLTVLCVALDRGGLSTLVLCTGGMALAVSLGVLFIPAPAGAGVRDVVLKLVLGVMLTSGQALAIVIASRVILIACDVTLAGVATLLRQVSKRYHPADAA